MLHAICDMLYVICYMLYVICYILYVICYMLYMLHSICYLVYAICYMLYALYYMLYATDILDIYWKIYIVTYKYRYMYVYTKWWPTTIYNNSCFFFSCFFTCGFVVMSGMQLYVTSKAPVGDTTGIRTFTGKQWTSRSPGG